MSKHFHNILFGGKNSERSKSALARLLRRTDRKRCQSPFETWKKENKQTRHRSANSRLQKFPYERINFQNSRKILASLEQSLAFLMLQTPFKEITNLPSIEIKSDRTAPKKS